MPAREKTSPHVGASPVPKVVRDARELENEPEEPPQMVEKHIVKTERYSEVVPVDAMAPAPLPFYPSPSPIEDQPVEPADDVESFLQSVTDDEEYTLRVDLLPDFQSTQRFGRGARTVYKSEIPFNPRTYLREIQNNWGPGDYRLTVFHQPGHRFKKRWSESVAAPVQIAGQSSASYGGAPANMAMQPFQSQVVAPVDPIEGFLRVAKQLGELKKHLWSGEPQYREGQTVAPATSPAPVASEDRIMENLLQLATKDEGLATRLLSRYLGEPASDEPPWWASLLKVVEPILPALLPRILAILVPGQVPAQLAGLPAGGFPGLPPGAFIPPPPPPPPQPSLTAGSHELPLQVFTADALSPGQAIGGQAVLENPDDDAPQFILIDKLVYMLNQCVQAGQVLPGVIEAGAIAVRSTLSASPDLAPLISMLVSGTADGALGMLAMLYPEMALARTNEVAIAAIEAFQVYLREGRQPSTPIQP